MLSPCETPLLAIAGDFPFVTFCDRENLDELCRIPTPCSGNARVVQVSDLWDSERQIVAVSSIDSRCDYAVALYDVSTQEATLTLRGHTSPVYGLCHISLPSSSRVVSGDSSSHVFVFDGMSGKRLSALPDPLETTHRIMCIPEWSCSEVFVGGSSSTQSNSMATLLRFDLIEERKVGVYSGHCTRVNALAGNVANNVLYSTSEDKTVKIWDRNSASCEHTLQLKHRGHALCCAEDKNLLIVGCSMGIVRLWDIRQMARRLRTKLLPSGLLCDLDRIDENRFVSGSVAPSTSLGGSGIHGIVAIWSHLSQDVELKELPGDVFGVCQLRRSSESLLLQQRPN